MPYLRDLSNRLEVIIAANDRRPRSGLSRLDSRQLGRLVAQLAREGSNLRVVEETILAAAGQRRVGSAAIDAFVWLVESGRVVLREVLPRDAYPLCDPYVDAPVAITNLAECSENSPQRTWIEIEVDHAGDVSVERMNLELRINGRTIFGLLDAHGRWRSDDLETGLCEVSLLEHAALRQREQDLQRLPRPGEVVWVAGMETSISLRTGAHHRVLISQPRGSYGYSA